MPLRDVACVIHAGLNVHHAGGRQRHAKVEKQRVRVAARVILCLLAN
jgi:hypothetical protein